MSHRRTERDLRLTVARLEDERTAVRGQLDQVLSSKGRRVILVAAHPLWASRAAVSWLLGRKLFRGTRELWSEFRARQIFISSISSPTAEWNPELRISGEVHEGLLCSGDSAVTFKTPISPGARFRTSCAVLPGSWDIHDQPVEFRASIHIPSGSHSIVRVASIVLCPARRWSDRRWRSLTVPLPPVASHEAVVSLETRTGGRAISAAWGDPILETQRSGSERAHILRSAFRRLREWGVRRTFTYARGRHRADDQAAAYTRWISVNTPDARSLEAIRSATNILPYRPLISIVTPVYNTPPEVLIACLESVRRQAYDNWEHCIADDGSTATMTQDVLRRYAEDPRVRLVTLERNQNVSAASNAALMLASGDYVALLDHDDELAPHALAEVVHCLNMHRDADVIYSDEDKLDERGERCDPYFKPDWSPELLLSFMYVCHLLVIRRQVIDQVGGFREGYEGAQDYDLLLRAVEKTERIHHIPTILYHWRKGPGSTAAAGAMKPWALVAGRRAVEDYARRAALAGRVKAGPYAGTYRFHRAITGQPLVSIVIPTTGETRGSHGDLLAQCLRSLDKTAWRSFEVILATDSLPLSGSAQKALERLPHTVVEYASQGRFNFSHKINDAVRRASGDHVVLLNDDVEVSSAEWLTSMLEFSQDQKIGAVGAKLVYPDGRIQHVGMLIGVGGIAAHAFHRSHPGSTGYAGSAIVPHNCSAVTAACLMTRRNVFDEVGGLDEDLPVDFNDVDFCLRVRQAGYRIVFTPYAQLVHHESASFGKRVHSAAELERMRQRWGKTLDRDPYYNPNLSTLFSDYRLQV